MYRVLTEITILVHLGFILFVVAGGLLVRGRWWLILGHGSALGWAVYAELSPGIRCPLTALENLFARRAGMTGYSEDFIAHYLVPVIYQEGLTPQWQRVVAAAVLGLNFFIYASLLWRRSQDAQT